MCLISIVSSIITLCRILSHLPPALLCILPHLITALVVLSSPPRPARRSYRIPHLIPRSTPHHPPIPQPTHPHLVIAAFTHPSERGTIIAPLRDVPTTGRNHLLLIVPIQLAQGRVYHLTGLCPHLITQQPRPLFLEATYPLRPHHTTLPHPLAHIMDHMAVM